MECQPSPTVFSPFHGKRRTLFKEARSNNPFILLAILSQLTLIALYLVLPLHRTIHNNYCEAKQQAPLEDSGQVRLVLKCKVLLYEYFVIQILNQSILYYLVQNKYS